MQLGKRLTKLQARFPRHLAANHLHLEIALREESLGHENQEKTVATEMASPAWWAQSHGHP